MAYYYAREQYRIVRELPAGKGFADLAFLPKTEDGRGAIPMLIELKWNKSVETAIGQIKERGYSSVFQGFENVLLVGIQYDKKSKKHACSIEKYFFA